MVPIEHNRATERSWSYLPLNKDWAEHFQKALSLSSIDLSGCFIFRCARKFN